MPTATIAATKIPFLPIGHPKWMPDRGKDHNRPRAADQDPDPLPVVQGLTPGTLRSYFRPPPKALRDGAPGDHRRASRGTFALLIRRQSRSSRGVKDILVTGITVTMLLTSVATASAQNIFEALFGRAAPAPGPVPDANFTARDSQQLATAPYRQAWIPPAYRR